MCQKLNNGHTENHRLSNKNLTPLLFIYNKHLLSCFCLQWILAHNPSHFKPALCPSVCLVGNCFERLFSELTSEIHCKNRNSSKEICKRRLTSSESTNTGRALKQERNNSELYKNSTARAVGQQGIWEGPGLGGLAEFCLLIIGSV